MKDDVAGIICQALELGCSKEQAQGHAIRLDRFIQQSAYPVCDGDSPYAKKCGYKRGAIDMGHDEEEVKADRSMRASDVTNAEGRAT